MPNQESKDEFLQSTQETLSLASKNEIELLNNPGAASCLNNRIITRICTEVLGKEQPLGKVHIIRRANIDSQQFEPIENQDLDLPSLINTMLPGDVVSVHKPNKDDPNYNPSLFRSYDIICEIPDGKLRIEVKTNRKRFDGSKRSSEQYHWLTGSFKKCKISYQLHGGKLLTDVRLVSKLFPINDYTKSLANSDKERKVTTLQYYATFKNRPWVIPAQEIIQAEQSHIKEVTYSPYAESDLLSFLNSVEPDSVDTRTVEFEGKHYKLWIIDIAMQLLRIVADFEAAKVEHRDIKLENLLIKVVNGKLELRITDIDSVVSYGNPELFHHFGTISYMPPELLYFAIHVKSKKIRGNSFAEYCLALSKEEELKLRQKILTEGYKYSFDGSHDKWSVGIALLDLLTNCDANKPGNYPVFYDLMQQNSIIRSLLAIDQEQRPTASSLLEKHKEQFDSFQKMIDDYHYFPRIKTPEEKLCNYLQVSSQIDFDSVECIAKFLNYLQRIHSALITNEYMPLHSFITVAEKILKLDMEYIEKHFEPLGKKVQNYRLKIAREMTEEKWRVDSEKNLQHLIILHLMLKAKTYADRSTNADSQINEIATEVMDYVSALSDINFCERYMAPALRF